MNAGEINTLETKNKCDVAFNRDGKITFTDGREIPYKHGVTEVKERQFKNNERIAEIRLPASVAAVGNRAFWACKGLLRLELPEGVKVIGPWAFALCEKLEYISFPTTLTELGISAFGLCF